MGKYSWSKFDFNKLVPVIEKQVQVLKRQEKLLGKLSKIVISKSEHWLASLHLSERSS